jgi:hypothetical protein
MVHGVILSGWPSREPWIGFKPSFDCSEKGAGKTGCICRGATITVCIGGARFMEGKRKRGSKCPTRTPVAHQF